MLRKVHSDNDLLQKIAEGDEKAFGELYALYCDKVFSIGMKILRSASMAEDITQEVFLKLWLNNKKLTDITHFKAYLYTITRNQVYNALRKQANEELLLSELIDKEHPQENIADAISIKQLRDRLHQSLSRLPVQQRKVFEMGKLQGMKHDEIAGLLLISSETVKKHMMAAVRAVKNFFL